jgi:hypothetical protein
VTRRLVYCSISPVTTAFLSAKTMRSLRAISVLILFAFPALASTPQFNPRQDINTNFQHLTGLAVADFDGDGKPDIAVTDNTAKSIVVYLNKGNGTFSAPISTALQIGAIGAGAIVAGDFNEDGKQDLIVGTVAGSQADVFLAGNGDGTFTQGQTLPSSFGFFSAAAVDLNHDSHLDLIGGGNGTLYVHLGDGHGGFTLQNFPNQGASDAFLGVVAGEFNNDSNVDFLATASSANNLRYFPGNGDGTFATPSTVSSSIIFSPQFLASADFNGDGKLDLLVGSASIATVILGNGDNTFQTGASQVHFLQTPPATNQNPQTATPVVGAADMNGDGKIDAVVADNASASINVFVNDGTGKFPQSAPDFTASLPVGSNQLQLADLNGDGLPDIVVTNYMTQNISIFLSIKQPTTAPTVTIASSANQILVGAPLTLTAQVNGGQGPIPTGSLTLLDGTTSLGQQTLNATGQAVFTVANLAAGQHSLSASYAGDNNYLPATSGTFAQSITDFQLSLSSPSQTVTSGAAATYNLSVTPVASFAGNIAVTCSGLPAGASCATTSASINGQPASIAVNVVTSASSDVRGGFHRLRLADGAVLSLASLLFFGFLPRRHRALPWLAASLIVFVGIGLSAGCSGNNSQPTPNPVTTAFTISGSATQAGQTVSHQVSASITIN